MRGRAAPTVALLLLLPGTAAAQSVRPGAIAGHVVRPDATPAEDATVVALVRAGETVREVARTASTFGGVYELAGLPPGRYVLAVHPAPGAFFGHDAASRAAAASPTYYPGVADLSSATEVPVFEGLSTEGIDVWLRPAPQRFTLSGRAWDEDTGRRLRHVAVEYSDEAGIRRGVWLVGDPDGWFVIDGVPPGTIFLLARGESDEGPMAGQAATVIGAGPAEDVRLHMGPVGSVTGRVHAPDEAGWSPDGIRVALVHTRQQVSILYPQAEAAADADGRFVLPRAFGAYRVDVRGLPEGWRVRQVRQEGRDRDGAALHVSHGEHVRGLEIVVGP